MKTLLDPDDRAAMVARIKALTPSSPRQWGTMTAGKMVTHLFDSTRMMLGEIPDFRNGVPVASWPPFKQLLMFYLPIPKGRAETAPQLLATQPGNFAADVDRLCQLIEQFAAPETPGGRVHPFFGAMDKRSWGILGLRHFDHHLRQFGG